MTPSKTVPVRLPDDVRADLEYLLKVANQDSFYKVNQSDIIRAAIQRLAKSVREKGSF